MTPIQLVEEINSLPPHLREQALNFIAFLKTKAKKQPPLPERQVSASKVLPTQLSDFTEPLEDLQKQSTNSIPTPAPPSRLTKLCRPSCTLPRLVSQ